MLLHSHDFSAFLRSLEDDFLSNGLLESFTALIRCAIEIYGSLLNYNHIYAAPHQYDFALAYSKEHDPNAKHTA